MVSDNNDLQFFPVPWVSQAGRAVLLLRLALVGDHSFGWAGLEASGSFPLIIGDLVFLLWPHPMAGLGVLPAW